MHLLTEERVEFHVILQFYNPTDLSFKFRVTQQVSELGWVDFVFGYSTVCLILRGNQNWQSRCAI